MIRRTLTGLLAATLLVAAFPLAASAQTEGSAQRAEVALTEEDRAERLERVKQHVIAQIERRLDTLERLTGKVASAKHITDDHAATLQAEYAAAQGVLRAGIEAVNSVTTLEELREVAPPIFESTLVYALLGPKTHLVIASDAVTAITARYADIGAKLQDALDRLAENGVDTTAAQADLDRATSLVADAAASGSPVAEAVIGLQPGDEIAGPLADGKAALEGTRGQLGEAKDLAKGVAEFIRSNLPES